MPHHKSISIPILQMKKLRGKEIKWVAQAYKADQKLNPGSLAPEPSVLTSIL